MSYNPQQPYPPQQGAAAAYYAPQQQYPPQGQQPYYAAAQPQYQTQYAPHPQYGYQPQPAPTPVVVQDQKASGSAGCCNGGCWSNMGMACVQGMAFGACASIAGNCVNAIC